MIALDLVIALLAGASDRQLDLAREVAKKKGSFAGGGGILR